MPGVMYVQRECMLTMHIQELRQRFDAILENAKDLELNSDGKIGVHSTCVIAWTHSKKTTDAA